MIAQTYICRRYKVVGTFRYSGDFAQSSSPIHVSFDDGESWQPVPFQVADCRHSRREAERMIAAYFK